MELGRRVRTGRGALAATLLLAAAGAASVLATAGGASATPLLGVTADGLGSTLYDVDETTGALSNPRSLVGGLGGLTWLDTGQLVATRHHISGYGLYEIDPVAGTSSLLVSFPTSVVEGGVAQDPDTGVVYAVNANPAGGGIPGLFSIDVTGGTTSFIGSVLDTDGSGSSMDLSALGFDLDGRLWAIRDIGALELVEIDPASGDVLSFMPITGGLPVSAPIAGLALDPDTGRFFFSYVDKLYDLDPVTGAATLIGTTGFEQLAGLAYAAGRAPEPDISLLLLAAAAGGLTWPRGRATGQPTFARRGARS
jgi:hypothetical protein